MKNLLLVAWFLLCACYDLPKPRLVCTTSVDSDCEDECVASSQSDVERCKEECTRRVCP